MARLGEKSWEKTFKKIEAIVTIFKDDLTLQPYSMLFYSHAYLLKSSIPESIVKNFIES